MQNFFLRGLVVFMFTLLLWGPHLWGQSPEILHWEDMEALLTADNDSLYVINFWATWCRPCVAEMPAFERLHAEMEADKVRVLFVSLDFVEEVETRVVPFLEKKQLQADVFLLDEPKYNTWIDKVSKEWSGAIPATIFVRQSTQTRVFHEGDFAFEELQAQVKTLIH